MEAYVFDHPDLPEEPVGTEMLVEIPVPEWGGSTVSLRDLLMVRAELRNRLRPRPGK
jgi:hypothetical protein